MLRIFIKLGSDAEIGQRRLFLAEGVASLQGTSRCAGQQQEDGEKWRKAE